MKDKRAFIIGDIHGLFNPIRAFYQQNKQELDKTDNYLICLGDFGANYFFDYRDSNFKQKLGTYPFTYFVIRGNHEERPSICMNKNPEGWHLERMWNNDVYVENDYPYIKYALDEPAVYNIEYDNRQIASTFIVPGAYSVDKYTRLNYGWSWFEGEQETEVERKHGLKLLKNDCYYDLVLTHTCPHYLEPRDLFISDVNQALVDKTMELYLTEISDQIVFKTWCWGHFHDYREYPRMEDDTIPTFANPRWLMLDTNVVTLDSVLNKREIEIMTGGNIDEN